MDKKELKNSIISYVDKVFFYCIKRCNNRMDAEDLSQNILLEVIKKIDEGVDIYNLDYYIWGICKKQYNQYLKETIKERNHILYKDEIYDADDSKSIHEEIIEDERIRKVNRAIKLLSKDYIEILYAYYVEDKTLKFIASELNLPLGTVGRRLADIRKKLKEYLEMEQLNGKKAYIPKNFGGLMAHDCNFKLDFNPHQETASLLIKNLLFHSYDNPCSLKDYSIELGISIAYIEDYVNRLLNHQYLIKTNDGKYLTNIAFVDKKTKRKIFDLVKDNIPILQKAYAHFCQENIQNYRLLLENQDIPNELLMWSLIFQVHCALEMKEPITFTKKFQNGTWDFCMVEQTNDLNTDEYFISMNTNTAENDDISVMAFPASVDNPSYKVGYRISYANASTGSENANLFHLVLDQSLKYSQLDEKTKKEIDHYLELNYFKIEEDIIKINPPVISRNHLNKLHDLIYNDSLLEKAFNEYSSKVYREIAKLFPSYLHNQISFIVTAVASIARSLVINNAYEQGLLSLDKEHQHFVYNMVIIKEK